MMLKDLFKKDIGRKIEGVIKADDIENIYQEVDEYVITNEISKRLDIFLDAYNNYQGANGVWISGFFGSGKSHLLKMLSYLLEDKAINGKKLSNIFLSKIEDKITKANFEKAIKIPSRSILFNIDQKTDIISSNQTDAILSVFMKVFNEMQGFYSKSSYIAEFERDMYNQGLYDKFKKTYQELSCEEWEKDRKKVHHLKNETFAKVLSKVNNTSHEEALKVLDKYRETYSLSIEDFAKHVKEYLDKQEKGFRLNFFVDEVGQFISDNAKLMLNLQTIAETLATKCNGQAWVFVTSQEDKSSIIGDMDARQGNDISKIMDRFANRMNLTSQDVAEVIQKRLLLKNETGIIELSPIYENEQNNFKTLFHFTDESRTYRNFRDNDHFTHIFPFLPYQFELFQASIMGLSSHNAFEGRHRSVGERSMLAVFQDVIKKIAMEPIGKIATYDLFFEGIRAALKSEIQNAVLTAEKNLTDDFAIRVLKVLFLVKYVKGFKSTTTNIAILLIDSFKINLLQHEIKIKEALNLLEQQTYIQRTGSEYAFLTDDEKDIETEIKATDIDTSHINELLADLIYSDVLRDSKIRFIENKQDYSYSRKLDDTLIGREFELSINVITQLHEQYSVDSYIISKSIRNCELMVVLPEDDKLEQDLRLHEKTQKYIIQTRSTTLKENIKMILEEKASQNRLRHENLLKTMKALLSGAKIYLNGSLLINSATEPKNRIHNAFQDLVRFTYPNLRMLKDQFSEDQIKSILLARGDDLFKYTDESLSEAEMEMFNFIQRCKNEGERTTVKSLLNSFSGKPYGWYQAGILCILSKLFVRGKVEIKHDTNILEKEQVLQNLSNNRFFENTIIEAEEEYAEKSIRELKNFHKEFFNEPNAGKDTREVAKIFQERLKEEQKSLEIYLRQKSTFKFLQKLDEACSLIQKIENKNFSYYFSSLKSFENELLNIKEEIIDPVKKFMEGSQKDIYEDVAGYLTASDANFSYIYCDEIEHLREVVNCEKPYKNNIIQRAKQAIEIIRKKEVKKITEERVIANKTIDQTMDKIKSDTNYSKLDDCKKEEIIKPFHKLKSALDNEKFIPVIINKREEIKDEIYQEQLKLLYRFINPEIKQEKDFISCHRIRPKYSKASLETEKDVAEYIEALKKEYIKIIKEHKGITL